MNRNRIIVVGNERLNNGDRFIGSINQVIGMPKEAGGSHET